MATAEDYLVLAFEGANLRSISDVAGTKSSTMTPVEVSQLASSIRKAIDSPNFYSLSRHVLIALYAHGPFEIQLNLAARIEIVRYLKRRMGHDLPSRFYLSLIAKWIREEKISSDAEEWLELCDVSKATIYRRIAKVREELANLKSSAIGDAEELLEEKKIWKR